MGKFRIKMSAKAEWYSEEIVKQLMGLFSISYEEAVGRFNKHWPNLDEIGDDDMFYHMLPEEWAHEIYYGAGTYWWDKDHELKPLPYNEEE